ncbi:MAG TPA: discoidin domain-containing protein [Candidatus Mediterraneibacter surreyensis]|nr:discoidin domain-containing protein [Candidatus Mediterraneibacter surreyensis]
MKKGKRIKRWGSLALAFATVAGGITVSSPQSANAAGDFAGELTSVDSAKADGNIVNISFNGGEVQGRVTFLENGIFRYNVDPTGEFEQYAKPNSSSHVARIQQQPDDSEGYTKPEAKVNDKGDTIEITNGTVTIVFDKDTALMSVKNGENVVLEETSALEIGDGSTVQTLAAADNEYFYGGGTQNGRFSHKGDTIRIANTNSWVDGGVSSPNPFYWSTDGYGVMRNTFKQGSYDFGSTEANTVKTTHNEQEFDAYYFIDPTPAGILNDYFKVTGNPALLPEYAFYLGHLNCYNRDLWNPSSTGSGWTLEDGNKYTETGGDPAYKLPIDETGKVPTDLGTPESLNGTSPLSDSDTLYKYSARAVIDGHVENDFPLGWFLPNDGYGCGYGQNGYYVNYPLSQTNVGWDTAIEASKLNVENLAEFTEYANSYGVDTGLWTQSGLDFSGSENDSMGYHGLQTLRDFNSEVNDGGITSLKTDVAWVGSGYSFGLNGVKTAYDTIAEAGTRPNVVSLDGWAGTQRYAGIWTGDQSGGEWEYIRFHIPTYIGQSLSGNPNIGSDMDGIYGGSNLMATRDFQWKSFTPLMLDMDGWGAIPKKPYGHGEDYDNIIRNYLKLKAQMMPYIYTIAEEATDGKPMIRAMFLEFPDDSSAAYTEASQYQYMWGENLLVAPVYEDVQADENGNDVRNGIYLPDEDQIWIDYWSGQQYRGGQILNNYDAPVWKLPLFVKSGAIIPMYEENNNPGAVTEINEKGLDKTKRIIEFWPDGETDFDLYEDDGRSIAVSKGSEVSYGGSVTTHITSSVDEDAGTATLTVEPSEGDYKGYDSERLTTFVVNVSTKPTKLAATNGDTTLELTEAESLEAFNADEDGNIYFYDESPNLNKYSQGEGTFASTKITTTPKLYVKFARTNVDANAQTLVVEGFDNSQVLDKNELNESLPAPELTELTEDDMTPTSINVQWTAPEVGDIKGYDISVDGEINTILPNSDGTVPTSYLHENLDYNSAHTYMVRVRTAEGYSNWSAAKTFTSLEDPWRNVPDVTATWSGELYNNQGPERACDHELQTGDSGFHSDGNAIGEELIYDLGQLYSLDKLEYYPRNDEGNGTVRKMDISVSRDGVHWQSVNAENNAMSLTTDSDDNKVATVDLKAASGTWRYVKMIPRESVGGFFSAREIIVYKTDGTNGTELGDMPGTSAGIDDNDFQTINSYKGIDTSSSSWGQITDVNLNGVFDIYDYSFTLTKLDGGTTKTGKAAGNILMLTNKDTVEAGEEFTIDLYGVDLENVNAFGAVVDLGDKYDVVSIEGSAYTAGMTDLSVASKYLTVSFGNRGDKALINGSHTLATITLKAKEAGDTLKLAEAMLIGPDNSLVICTNEAGEIPEVPPATTTTKYVQSDFNISMTNEAHPTDDGTNVTTFIQQNSYDGLFNGVTDSSDRSFEFIWDMGQGVPDDVKLPVTIHFAFNGGAKPLSEVNVYDSYAKSNGFVTKYEAVVIFEDGTKYETGEVDVEKTDGAVMTVDVAGNNPDGKNVKQVDFTVLESSTGEQAMTLTEAEFIYEQSNTVDIIEFTDAPSEMFIGDIVEISAAVSPEDAPYRYYDITSSDPDKVEVIRIADGDNFKFYLKAKEATEEDKPVTLTAKAGAKDAEGNAVTAEIEITVNEGVNTEGLQALIDEYNNVSKDIYTQDSYDNFKEAYDKAVELLRNPAELTKNDVENAEKALSDAIDGLTFREIDEDTLINTSADSGVTVSSVKSEIDEGAGNGLSGNVLDYDEDTYWHSNWSTSVEMPQWLIFDLGDTYELSDITFLPRVGSSNGDIFEVEILVGETQDSMTSVGTFKFDHSEKELLDRDEWKQITFAPVEGRYVKFNVVHAGGGTNGAAQNDQYATMSEIRFYGTTPAAPVDITALQEAVEAYGSVTNDGYTDTTWAAYVNALATAQNMLAALQNDPTAYTQEEVNAAADALETAVNNLAKPEDPDPGIPENPDPENPDPDKPGTGTGDGSGSGSGSGTGSGSGSGNGAVSTGDSTNIYVILMMLILSGGAIVFTRRKKNS